MNRLTCTQTRKYLMAYLDSELETAVTLAVSEHLEQCAPCRLRFEQEQRLETVLADELRGDRMPDDVWERVTGALPGPHRNRQWRWLAAAAIVLLAAWLALDDPGRRDLRPGELAGALSAQHLRFVSGQAVPGTRGRDAVRALLSSHDMAGLDLPADGMHGKHGLRLLGAQPAVLGGVDGVEVLFDCCGVVTSLFALPLDGLEDALQPGRAEVGELIFDTAHQDGLLLSVVTSHDAGLLANWAH